MKVLDASIGFSLAAETRGLTGGIDVEGDLAIETLNLFLRLLALEIRKLRRSRLLDPLPAVGDVDDSPVVINFEGLVVQVGLQILPEVVVHAGAINGQGLHRGNRASPADGLQRIVHELLFGRHRCTSRDKHSNYS